MNTNYEEIQAMIQSGKLDCAQTHLSALLDVNSDDAYLLYLQGNLFRKQGKYTNALSFYMRSELLDANSPAAQAREMLEDIMNFYNKDMYNQ